MLAGQKSLDRARDSRAARAMVMSKVSGRVFTRIRRSCPFERPEHLSIA